MSDQCKDQGYRIARLEPIGSLLVHQHGALVRDTVYRGELRRGCVVIHFQAARSGDDYRTWYDVKDRNGGYFSNGWVPVVYGRLEEDAVAILGETPPAPGIEKAVR